jgi:hypothetical protein
MKKYERTNASKGIAEVVRELEEELREVTPNAFHVLEELRESWNPSTSLEIKARDLTEAIKAAAPSKREKSEARLVALMQHLGFSEAEARLFAQEEKETGPDIPEHVRRELLTETLDMPVVEADHRRHDAWRDAILMQE